MHMSRFPIGTRIEEAGKIAVLVNAAIERLLPGQVTGNVIDNCGLPISSINQAYNSSGTIGPQDCDVTISLTQAAAPVERFQATLRHGLPSLFPGTEFTFLPGDITAKILNFGLPVADRRAGQRARPGGQHGLRPEARGAGCAASPASPTRSSSRRWTSRPCASPRRAPSRSAPG